MNIIVETLDPEWTCYARCPLCPARTFACCKDHALSGMREHITTEHA